MARGDWFLDLFTSEAEKLIENVAATGGGWGGQAPVYWWVPGLPDGDGGYAKVAAVDGGGGVIELSGGSSIYVARAFGYVEDGEPERLLELKLVPARDTRVLDALRSWLEHRVAVRLALRLPPGSLILMDGSYWATIVAAAAAVARLATGRVQSVAGVYAGILSGHLLHEAASLAATAQQRGVTIAYVSKDHRLRALKEKILLEEAAARSPAIREAARRALEWYPLALRDELLEARKALNEPTRSLVDAALDPSYRDTVFIDEAVGRTPGYTWSLRLPPPLRLYRLVSRHTPRGLAEKLTRNAEKLLGGRDAEEAEALIDKLPRALDQLPAPTLFYLRPSPEDQPLLVETPGPQGSFLSPGRVLEEPSPAAARLAAALAARYNGPIYYNTPLIAAHINATLDAGQLENYRRLLTLLAAARGVELTTTRRTSMTRLTHRRRRRRLH